jgi:hypothetical protein
VFADPLGWISSRERYPFESQETGIWWLYEPVLLDDARNGTRAEPDDEFTPQSAYWKEWNWESRRRSLMLSDPSHYKMAEELSNAAAALSSAANEIETLRELSKSSNRLLAMWADALLINRGVSP